VLLRASTDRAAVRKQKDRALFPVAVDISQAGRHRRQV
jgi:hypothetical protein